MIFADHRGRTVDTRFWYIEGHDDRYVAQGTYDEMQAWIAATGIHVVESAYLRDKCMWTSLGHYNLRHGLDILYWTLALEGVAIEQGH